MGRVCSICKQEKSAGEFPKNKRSKDGLFSYCTLCNRKKALEYIRGNPEARKKRRSDVRKALLEAAQCRASSQGIPINITEEDILVPDVCPVLGIVLKKEKGRASSSSPSLDKIDPTLGYMKGNVQVISNKANRMKSDASKEELVKFAKWILKEYEHE